jgi:VWFA-related protein
MRRSVPSFCGLLLGLPIIAFFAATPSARQAAPQNAQPTYRSAVTLVPVDVRVIDTRTGVPVTDLKQEEFTLFENDVRQAIRHFALQSYGTPRTGELAGRSVEYQEQPALRTSPLSVVSQTRRVFLIVLARGRLQSGPAKALDAAADFVRHLLPRDQVAVFGYDRATDFTTYHEQAAQVIDRFKADNDGIAGILAQQQGGLAAIYGSRELPASVQERIDRIFRGTSSLPYSPVGRATAARTGDQVKQDTRKQTDNALDNMVAAGRIRPAEESGRMAPDVMPGTEWEAFDGFAGRNMQTLDDTKNLYAAIAYMQRLEGEKHLVFLTPGGLNLQHLEDYDQISAMAADARVALDVVWSGFGGALQMKAMRGLSEDTGGVSSIAEYGQVALDRVDITTRTGYLLGYYPSNTRRNGDYRRIRVSVNRPGVTVLFRHGYRASDEIPAFNRRDYITQFRMEAAARRTDDIKDIGVKMHATLAVTNGRNEVAVEAVIDPSHLAFHVQEGLHVGRFEIAVVAMDSTRQILSSSENHTMAPQFTDERFARIQKEGVSCTVRMPVPSGTRYVRFIVYDYEADLVGTAGTSVF